MREWHKHYNGRMHLKKQFLGVREDPFHSSNVTGLCVLRIEVYPETEEDRYFHFMLEKNKKVVKVETCYFDEQGKLQVVSGEDAYGIIVKSYDKTHIKRQKAKTEEEEES